MNDEIVDRLDLSSFFILCFFFQVNDEIVDRLDLCSVLDVIMDEDYVLMPGVTVVLHRNIYLNIDYISIDMHMDEDVLGP